jgi:glycosyltransferase involved in cell wall biosynthesis
MRSGEFLMSSHNDLIAPSLHLTLKISVLISVYAKESPEYLREALHSLVEQTVPANQIVLVCDGPLTPFLERVIDEFTILLPLTLVRLHKNVGLAYALNAGLPYCKYEWIARFDSDDLCEKLRFEMQLEFICNNPDVDVFGSNILEFETNSRTPHAIRQVKVTHEEILATARFRNPLNHMTVFFRKAIVLKADGYPHDALNEDYALWVKLMMSGCKFGNLSTPLVRARAGEKMVSRRGGFSYLLTELQMQRRLKRLGFISTRVFVFNISVRVVVRLVPNFLRRIIYTEFLRSRP